MLVVSIYLVVLLPSIIDGLSIIFRIISNNNSRKFYGYYGVNSCQMKWVIIIFSLVVVMVVGNLLMLKHIDKKSFSRNNRRDDP